jgi:hypothetical protein
MSFKSQVSRHTGQTYPLFSRGWNIGKLYTIITEQCKAESTQSARVNRNPRGFSVSNLREMYGWLKDRT